MNKKLRVLYIDMDNTLVDFRSGLNWIDEEVKAVYKGKEDEIPGIFSRMDPLPGALVAFAILSEHFDTYILSTAPWKNPSAWRDKLLWVQKYLGEAGYKRLILTHHKELNNGDYLVDDDFKGKAAGFQGELIKFGTGEFKDWPLVVEYLLERK